MRIAIIILFGLLFSCSSPSIIYVTEVDTIVVVDTVQLAGDSIWYGGIYNGSDSIGSIAVHPKSKQAIVNIKWLKPDSVAITVNDTKYIVLSKTITDVLSILFVVMPFYQKLILIILLIGALFIVYKLWKK